MAAAGAVGTQGEGAEEHVPREGLGAVLASHMAVELRPARGRGLSCR